MGATSVVVSTPDVRAVHTTPRGYATADQPPPIGTRVEVHSMGDGKWYDGRVISHQLNV